MATLKFGIICGIAGFFVAVASILSIPATRKMVIREISSQYPSATYKILLKKSCADKYLTGLEKSFRSQEINAKISRQYFNISLEPTLIHDSFVEIKYRGNHDADLIRIILAQFSDDCADVG